MLTYDVIAYDVWGNKQDGFTVNNAFRTGDTVEIKADATDSEIFKALRKAGLFKGVKQSSYDIEGDFEYGLYINRITQDVGGLYPVCELRPTN